MRKKFGLRSRVAGLTVLAASAAVLLMAGGASATVTGAVNTTDDPFWSGPATSGGLLGAPTQPCTNGPASPPRTDPAVNCNIYNAKTDVFLSGSPNPAALGAGTYFFAVLAPGGQPNANDSGAKNLSVFFDAASKREFSSDGFGAITPLDSPHAYDGSNNVLQVAPFQNTPNPGGVYILAVCQISGSENTSAITVPTVTAQDCKYDAFKVLASVACDPNTDPACGTSAADDLAVEKTAFPKATFTWDAKKAADKTTITQNNGSSAVFTYTASYTPSGPTDSITGDITVTNPNDVAVPNVVITDALNDAAATACTVKTGTYYDSGANKVNVDPTGDTIPALTVVDYPYTCSPPDRTATLNTATVSWDNTTLGAPDASQPGTASIDWAHPTLVDDCVNATDLLDSAQSATTLAKLCVDKDGDLLTPSSSDVNHTYGNPAGVTVTIIAATTTVPAHFDVVYKQTFTVPATTCATHTNTADFVTDTNSSTDGTLGDNTVTVSVCPKVNGLTIGYWQNKNGQGQINSGTPTGTCQLLFNYLTQFNPFKDLITAICGTSAGYTQNKSTASTGIAGYVYNIIKAANASGASMNAMLKAQMLGTALSTYFSTSGLSQINIDLTKICNMIDNSGTGTGTCGTGGYLTGVGAAFTTNGTLPGSDPKFGLTPSDPLASGGCATNSAPTAMSVECLLWNAASWSNSGGTAWYGQIKTTQGLAKNTFDAINNSAAVAAGP